MTAADNQLYAALNGALAGMAARTVTAPLDVIKIRLQVQNSFYPQYLNIYDTCKSIFANEGFKGFWKGNLFGLLLYGMYGAVQFYTLERLSLITGEKFLSGAASAILSTLITFPFDTLRTQFAVKKNQTTAREMLLSMRFRHLYRGALPSVLQVGPYMGTVFASHELFNQYINIGNDQVKNFISGAVAGALGKTVTMPFDVVRKRMQIQGNRFDNYEVKNIQRFARLSHCIAYTWLNEGPRGFFKGLPIALFKSVPATATTLMIYHWLDNRPRQKS